MNDSDNWSLAQRNLKASDNLVLTEGISQELVELVMRHSDGMIGAAEVGPPRPSTLVVGSMKAARL